jgi:hypothetical protein
MPKTILSQIRSLRRMTVPELQARWLEVFGTETRQRERDHLWRKLAERLQEDLLSSLSPEDRATVERHREEICRMPPEGWFPGARHNRGRSKPPRSTHDRRIPGPGSAITRTYKGRELTVMVLDKGFEYRGHIYRSLSAIAREITGTNWNGYTFFGLNKESSK